MKGYKTLESIVSEGERLLRSDEEAVKIIKAQLKINNEKEFNNWFHSYKQLVPEYLLDFCVMSEYSPTVCVINLPHTCIIKFWRVQDGTLNICVEYALALDDIKLWRDGRTEYTSGDSVYFQDFFRAIVYARREYHRRLELYAIAKNKKNNIAVNTMTLDSFLRDIIREVIHEEANS